MKWMRGPAVFLLSGIMLLSAHSVLADVLPGSALPEQVSKSITSQQPKAKTQVLPPVVTQEEKAASPLGPEAEKIKFKLNGIILEGNHVYSKQMLSLIYQNQVGKTITVNELFQIVQNITNFYRNNGYIISRAILPPQHVKNGVVRIQIIEGYLDQVSVSGEPRGAKCITQAYGNQIKKCSPLQLSRMERYLLIANETPATSVKAVLAPSKKAKGAADLTLVTQQKPVTGYLSYDNYGTQYIGPQQMTANIAFNSAIASGDATQFTFTKTPQGKELTYADLNYNLPVGDEGVRWLIGGTQVSTHPMFVLEPADINGTNGNYYTNLQYPIIRSRSQALTLQVGFNWLDSHVTTFDEELYTDHLRSLGISGTYNFADSWYGANLIYADIRQGLPIFDYTNDTSLTAQTSHPGGRGDYTKIDLQLTRLQAIKGPISLYGTLKGQWAFNALLASEQFTFGGSQLGRGYDVAELIGDRGAAGSLELRYDWGLDRFLMRSIQGYIFYDAGEIWNIIASPAGTPKKVSATSTGFGARFYMTNYISGNVMWTQPLTKVVATEELVGDGTRPRVFFSIVASLS